MRSCSGDDQELARLAPILRSVQNRRMKLVPILPLLASLVLAAPAVAQTPTDAVSVIFFQRVYYLDLAANTKEQLATTSQLRPNALAVDASGEVWITGSPTSSAPNLFLRRIDPFTGDTLEERVILGLSSVRGLTFLPDGSLLAAEGSVTGGPSMLYEIEEDGSVTLRGPVGSLGIQSLIWFDDRLVGGTTDGVYELDPATGAPVATLLSGTPGMQWLAEDACGDLYGGWGKIHRLDLDAGTWTDLGFLAESENRGFAFQPIPGVAEVLPGSPANPLVFDLAPGTVAEIGQPLTLWVDHTTFVSSSVQDLLLIGLAPANVPTFAGTLTLVPVAGGPTSFPQVGQISFAISDSCALLGLEFFLQAASISPESGIQLTNGLRIQFGWS